VVSRGGCN